MEPRKSKNAFNRSRIKNLFSVKLRINCESLAAVCSMVIMCPIMVAMAMMYMISAVRIKDSSSILGMSLTWKSP